MKKLIGLAAVLLLASCNQTSEQQAETEIKPIRFTTIKWNKIIGDCEMSNCVQIDISLLQANDGNVEVADKINEYLKNEVVEGLNNIGEEDIKATSIDGGLDSFLRSYNRFVTEFPEAPGAWKFKVEGEILMQNDTMISIRQDISTYTGGAHPNAVTSLVSIQIPSATQIPLSGITTNKEGLKKLAEEKFRQKFNIDASASLEDQGFLFPDGNFKMPENYAFIPEGLLLYYNAYEAAAYAEGPVELVISYEDLKNL